MGQWSDLPKELLELIEDNLVLYWNSSLPQVPNHNQFPMIFQSTTEDNLVLYEDKVRARAACAYWNSSLPQVPNHNQFPMIFQTFQSTTEEASHALFNPIDKKRYLLNLHNFKGMLFKGSSHGWLVTIGKKDDFKSPDMSLLNPLTSAQIKLPSRTKFTDVVNYRSTKVGSEYNLYVCEEGIDTNFFSSDEVNFEFTIKFVLSSAPFKGDECFIVGIYGPQSRLAYCKLNDTRWTPVLKSFGEGYSNFADVILHKGKLLALRIRGGVLAFEKDGTRPFSKWTEIARDLPLQIARDYPVGLMPYAKHLVASSNGGLMLVSRLFKDIEKVGCEAPYSLTCCFKVFKLNEANSCWVQVQNIGDDVLFVGLNSSLSILSCNCPEIYKRNHIYFTDSNTSFGDFIYTKMDEHSDTGSFNLGDGTLHPLPGFVNNPAFIWPPPLWLSTLS